MKKIIAISDIKSYDQLLANVKPGHEVVLTEDGKEKYVISDYEEYQKVKAALTLFGELQRGIQSLHDEGPISLEELRGRMDTKM